MSEHEKSAARASTSRTADSFDVIVVGGGPIGQAAAYHLSRRGAKTLVLEQFNFGNQLGSSAGASRQFRIPYPEQYMVKLVKQSLPFWEELQATTPVRLMDTVGTLWFGDPAVHSTEGNIGEAEKALSAEGVPYTKVDADDLARQYRFRDLPPTYTGLFQASGASINLKATLRALLEWNQASPHVTLRDEAPVIAIRHDGDVFHVTTPLGTFQGKKLVLVPGPFGDALFRLLGFALKATYWNLASAYFRKLDPAIQYPTWFVFQNPVGDNGSQFYGFPEAEWDHPGYIRVSSDFVIQALDSPAQRTLIPDPRELAFTAAWVRDHMTGLDPVPQFTSTCMVSLSTLHNKEMLLDFAPEDVPHHQDIVVYATGWAAKFVPLLGRILSDLALDGKTPFDISNFRQGRTYFYSFAKEQGR